MVTVNGKRADLLPAGDIMLEAVADADKLIRLGVPAFEDGVIDLFLRFAPLHGSAAQTDIQVGAQAGIVDECVERCGRWRSWR